MGKELAYLTDGPFQRGFLPPNDPVTLDQLPDSFSFLRDTQAIVLDLPNIHQNIATLPIVEDMRGLTRESLQTIHTAYGFLTSAFFQSTKDRPVPQNVAIPFFVVSQELGIPPILAYPSYTLANWERIDRREPISLDNVRPLLTFTNLPDEEHFIKVHIGEEYTLRSLPRAALAIDEARKRQDLDVIARHLTHIGNLYHGSAQSLEHVMYHGTRVSKFVDTIRPFFMSFRGVTYRGVGTMPSDAMLNGVTAAQSSFAALADALFGITHEKNDQAFLDMMNKSRLPLHRALLARLTNNAVNFSDFLSELDDDGMIAIYNNTLEEVARYRQSHADMAEHYLGQTQGSGGSEGNRFLRRMVEDTRKAKRL